MGQNKTKPGAPESSSKEGGAEKGSDAGATTKGQGQSASKTSSQGNNVTAQMTTGKTETATESKENGALLEAGAGQTGTSQSGIQDESDKDSASKAESEEESDEGYIKFDDEENEWHKSVECKDGVPSVVTLTTKTTDTDLEDVTVDSKKERGRENESARPGPGSSRDAERLGLSLDADTAVSDPASSSRNAAEAVDEGGTGEKCHLVGECREEALVPNGSQHYGGPGTSSEAQTPNRKIKEESDVTEVEPLSEQETAVLEQTDSTANRKEEPDSAEHAFITEVSPLVAKNKDLSANNEPSSTAEKQRCIFPWTSLPRATTERVDEDGGGSHLTFRNVHAGENEIGVVALDGADHGDVSETDEMQVDVTEDQVVDGAAPSLYQYGGEEDVLEVHRTEDIAENCKTEDIFDICRTEEAILEICRAEEDILEICSGMLQDTEKYQNIQEDLLALTLLLKRNGPTMSRDFAPEVLYTSGCGKKVSSLFGKRPLPCPSLSQELSDELNAPKLNDHDLTNLSILNMLTALVTKPSESEMPMRLTEKVRPIAGMMSTLRFDIQDKRWYHDILESPLTIEGRDRSMRTIFCEQCRYRPDKPLSVSFRPRAPGLLIISVRAAKKSIPESVFMVQVEGSSTLLWFNQGSSWPVALHLNKATETLWVAYTDHICLFTLEGVFTDQVLQLESGYINDLSVSPSGDRYAISLSGWEEIQEVLVRYQEVRVYDGWKAEVLCSVGRDPIIFEVPVLCLDFIDEDKLVIADRDALCKLSIQLGDLEQRCGPTVDLGTVSKVRHCGGLFYVVDGATSTVKTYNDIGQHLSSLVVTDDDGEPFTGLRCVDVDENDNIIVCDSVSNAICAYRRDGTVINRVVPSHLNLVLWPVGVATTGAGEVFVADHGNASIKKFAYL